MLLFALFDCPEKSTKRSSMTKTMTKTKVGITLESESHLIHSLLYEEILSSTVVMLATRSLGTVQLTDLAIGRNGIIYSE